MSFWEFLDRNVIPVLLFLIMFIVMIGGALVSIFGCK